MKKVDLICFKIYYSDKMMFKEVVKYENILNQYCKDWNFCSFNHNMAVDVYITKKNLKKMNKYINFTKIEKLKGYRHYLLTF
jgi:hypothetical protein